MYVDTDGHFAFIPILIGIDIGLVVEVAVGYAVGASVGSGAVLWSGKGMSEAAKAFARQNGLKTLEGTMRGKLLTVLGKNYHGR